MLGGIFHKRKKIQELRAPTLQDIKRFREIYGRHAEARHVETPSCFERSIYKAISCQKELHAIDFRQEDVTDPQIIALAETLLDMPLVSTLDLRDNRITDDGVKALLEVLRLQIIAAKTTPKTDPKTKKPLPTPPVPEFTRYITNVNLKGNEISATVLDEMTQYTDILKREDKRLEIRAALNQIDRNSTGGIDEEDFKAVVKLLTGTEPSKKEVKQLMSQSNVNGDNSQNSTALENVLLAKCSSSPSKKAACPPWEALVQVRHANIGPSNYLSPRSSRNTGFYQDSQQDSSCVIQPNVDNRGPSMQNVSMQSKQVENQVGKVTMTTLSTSKSPTMVSTAAAAPLPPPGPIAPSPTGPLSISTPDGDSPSKKVDFRPPSSPPPPLPLPQTATPERRSVSGNGGTPSSRPSLTIDASTDRVASQTSSVPDDGSNSSTKMSTKPVGSPAFTRQDSSESQRFGGAASPHSTVVSPKSRDDYTMDFSSWQDDDLFGDENNDSPVVSPGTKNADDAESVRSQVPSRQNDRTSGDLSSLAYTKQIGGGPDHGRDSSQVRASSPTEHRDLEPAVEDEEFEESTVLDIMKDGKPRNVAKVRSSEFKRGLGLQEFPGEVPFRNLIALILSENGLRDLSLFKECRFPCTTVLDLSHNALVKVNDEELACFPKLQVLDLSNNRLRVISGLGKLFSMKALSLCNNQLRSVINIEHLVHLQILRLRSNAITASSALRLLSLNKLLTHLDLDDNPLMETDDRQRRKITVHILNIIPTLKTLGSVSIACHITKDKRKVMTVDTPMGKSVLEHDECPSLHTLWVSNACDILQIVQDPNQPPRKSSYDDDDHYEDPTSGGYSPSRQKKLSREEQRQKDELRSKFIGHRSRGKAPPSPIRTKSSPFEFGPPQAPQRKSPKKKPLIDPKLAKEQKRRASQLSEPKYPPVDTDQLKQEQRRKSRPTFDVNMSVAERLQLVREKSLRRTSTLAPQIETGTVHRNSGSQQVTHHAKRIDHPPALIMEIRDQNQSLRHSPTRNEHIVEFRIEPLAENSPRRTRESNQQSQSIPSPTPTQSEVRSSTLDTSCERKPSSKETLFLQSLAVTDFLSHAEEEISTALTALNVLLSMCERSPSDPKKLHEYRNSLDALDILNEHESLTLYERACQHDDPSKVQACKEAFDKLGTLKKCIKKLLEKLETHAPGSPTIQSYCSDLRATELRHIIDSRDDDPDVALESPINGQRVSELVTKETATSSSGSTQSGGVARLRDDAIPSTSLNSRLFASCPRDKAEAEPLAPPEDLVERAQPPVKEDDDVEFDFLSSDTSMFDDDTVPGISEKIDSTITEKEEVFVAEEASFEDTLVCNTAVATTDSSEEDKIVDEDVAATVHAVVERNERSVSATSTDITQDIQQLGIEDDVDFDFDAELPLDHTEEKLSTHDDDAPVEVVPPEADTPVNEVEGTDEQDEIDWITEEATLDGEDQLANVESNMEVEDETDAIRVNEEEELIHEDTAMVEEECEDTEEQVEGQEEVVEGDDEDDEEAEMFGDWEKGFDPNTNHYFWFNHETGESQWVPPEGWPYEVDTPFEEDVNGEEEEMAPEGEEDSGQVDVDATQDEHESDLPPTSSFETDDDVFSDQDLPDF